MANKKTSTINTSSAKEEIKKGKVCAMLAYLLVGIVWYFVDEKMKKNNFIKFHVKQSLVLLIVSFAGSIVLGMTFIFAWLIPLYQVAILVMIIIGIMNANNEQEKELPIIGQFGNKFKF
ncbi:MAG: hypothetical protein U9R14_02430 [Patescibacteria group bacterium]|nr:hypothetical protein [Patescibacteria group bacterium]